MGESINLSDRRELEMVVRVLKKDGRVLCEVPEKDLEPYGWGVDPLQAVEGFRAQRNREIQEDVAKGQPRRESWDNTVITVVSDEAAGYPVHTFRLTGEIAVDSTRSQAALREIGQALIDIANGGELPDHITARIQFLEEIPEQDADGV